MIDDNSALTSRTKAEAVAHELRQLIRSGQLAGGDHLRQVDIARRFGVSTTPVREAFALLARERLLIIDAHRGAFVFAVEREHLVENFEIRAVLEGMAGRLAAQRITPDELGELDTLLLEMERTIKKDPAFFTSVLNPRFHGLINAASRRPHLNEMISGLRAAAMSYQALLVTPPGDNDDYADQVHAEHVAIVDALRRGASRQADDAVRLHIEHGMAMVLAGLFGPEC